MQIMLSAYHGHAPLVTLLLQHGADPNRLNDRGQSPLAGAVFKNEREVIHALLAGNADPRIGEPSALDACKVCFLLSKWWIKADVWLPRSSSRRSLKGCLSSRRKS